MIDDSRFLIWKEQGGITSTLFFKVHTAFTHMSELTFKEFLKIVQKYPKMTFECATMSASNINSLYINCVEKSIFEPSLIVEIHDARIFSYSTIYASLYTELISCLIRKHETATRESMDETILYLITYFKGVPDIPSNVPNLNSFLKAREWILSEEEGEAAPVSTSKFISENIQVSD